MRYGLSAGVVAKEGNTLPDGTTTTLIGDSGGVSINDAG
jgi:hypothetical protein